MANNGDVENKCHPRTQTSQNKGQSPERDNKVALRIRQQQWSNLSYVNQFMFLQELRVKWTSGFLKTVLKS